MKTIKSSYRKLPGNKATEAKSITRKTKRKTVIKTGMLNTDYGMGKTTTSGYKTKIKYGKSGGIKKAKTKRMGAYKTINMM